MSSSDDHNSPHILVFPYPAQGHMLPLLDLTHQLSLRGLTLTILITPKNLTILNPLLSKHPSIETLILPFPPHPKIPAGVEHLKDLGNSGNVSVIAALSNLQDDIIRWFNSQGKPPVAILSDFFLGWTLHLTKKLNIQRICFYSSGAFLTAVSEYCWRNIDKVSSSVVVEFPHLPRSPAFLQAHLPSIFRQYRKLDPDWRIVRDGIFANFASWGCVFNSFEALEKEYFECVEKRMVTGGGVYSIGPINLLGLDPLDRGDWGSGSNMEVMEWLDGCPDGSVIYVCFGSQKLMSMEQMEALGSGLDESGVRFVWVVKPGSDGYGVVPDRFEDRVKGRGVVIKGWAPQVTILNHRAVGGFLTHCGWNSIQEAVVSGVIILGWPMEADQFVNARLLVEDMDVGIRVCEGPNTVPDPGELAKVISESMNGSKGQKVRAKELREEALAAVSDVGSSARDLDRLVKDLIQLQLKNV